MKITFTEIALADYIYWQTQDKKTLKRINTLIKDIQRNKYDGIGKPEPLKGRKAYSRRIDAENRLIYVGDGEQNVVILSCKGHYEDK